eukprot:3105784-Rhodomonas_salina.2
MYTRGTEWHSAPARGSTRLAREQCRASQACKGVQATVSDCTEVITSRLHERELEGELAGRAPFYRGPSKQHRTRASRSGGIRR